MRASARMHNYRGREGECAELPAQLSRIAVVVEPEDPRVGEVRLATVFRRASGRDADIHVDGALDHGLDLVQDRLDGGMEGLPSSLSVRHDQPQLDQPRQLVREEELEVLLRLGTIEGRPRAPTFRHNGLEPEHRSAAWRAVTRRNARNSSSSASSTRIREPTRTCGRRPFAINS